MRVLKRAFVGLAIAGAVFSMSGTAHAESKFYGGYPDSGNCNYWRSGREGGRLVRVVLHLFHRQQVALHRVALNPAVT